MPARLNNTNFVGARGGSLLPEGHEEQALTFASHRVSKTDSGQKAHGKRTYGCFRDHQTLQTVRSW